MNIYEEALGGNAAMLESDSFKVEECSSHGRCCTWLHLTPRACWDDNFVTPVAEFYLIQNRSSCTWLLSL
eukprot:2104995-Amphidinium_carterae.1